MYGILVKHPRVVVWSKFTCRLAISHQKTSSFTRNSNGSPVSVIARRLNVNLATHNDKDTSRKKLSFGLWRQPCLLIQSLVQERGCRHSSLRHLGDTRSESQHALGDMSEGGKALEPTAIVRPIQSNGQPREVVEQLYSPLHAWETRILGLQPGDLNDPLVATLYVAVITHAEGFGLVDKDEIVEFEALSYTWGDETLSHSLSCNDITIGITSNLSTALQKLRRSKEVRYLWVDAVCIDQSNYDEKARQIRNLRIVFRKAARVIAWLGEEGERTEAAVNVLRNASAAPGSDALRLFIRSLSHREVGEAISGLLDLVKRPWLSRAWVVQEVCAAKLVIVCCGSCVINWNQFCQISICLGECDRAYRQGQQHGLWPDSEESGPFTTITRAISFLSDQRESGYGTDLSTADALTERATQIKEAAQIFYDTLQQSSHLKAKDPRDRIWALLGLSKVPVTYGTFDSPDSEILAINIDYNKPVPLVYAEVTRFFLRLLRWSELLLPFNKSFPVDRPSWSLDLETMKLPKVNVRARAQPQLHLPAFIHQETIEPSLSSASQNRAAKSKETAWNIFKLRGWHIGTVHSMKNVSINSDARQVDRSEERMYTSSSWMELMEDENIAKTTLDVLSTPCLQSWIWKCAYWPSMQWNQRVGKVPADHVDMRATFLARLSPRGSQLSLIEHNTMERFTRKFVWRIAGKPKVNDKLVFFCEHDFATVLRPLGEANYSFIGYARPIPNLMVLIEDDVPSTSVEELWKLSEAPYHPRPPLEMGTYEDEEIFSIC